MTCHGRPGRCAGTRHWRRAHADSARGPCSGEGAGRAVRPRACRRWGSVPVFFFVFLRRASCDAVRAIWPRACQRRGLRARGASSERWLGTLGESLARPCLCDWRRRYLTPLPPWRRQCIGPRSMAAVCPSPGENLALVIWSQWWWRLRRHVLLGGTTEEELA
jgi:hypothetical protein